jgi:hypothetical protein
MCVGLSTPLTQLVDGVVTTLDADERPEALVSRPTGAAPQPAALLEGLF